MNFSLETIPLILFLAGGYVLLLWLAITLWIARDAIARSHSVVFHFLAVFLNVVLPFFGAVLYFLFRPSQSLLEKYYEELERRAFGERPYACFFCGHLNGTKAKFCTDCGEKLHETCGSCKKETIRGSRFCEHCGESFAK